VQAADTTVQGIVAHASTPSDQHQLAPTAAAIEAALGRSQRNCWPTPAIGPGQAAAMEEREIDAVLA
jgi:hypothetical protein